MNFSGVMITCELARGMERLKQCDKPPKTKRKFCAKKRKRERKKQKKICRVDQSLDFPFLSGKMNSRKKIFSIVTSICPCTREQGWDTLSPWTRVLI